MRHGLQIARARVAKWSLSRSGETRDNATGAAAEKKKYIYNICIPKVQTVISLMRAQSATWTDRRIRPAVHERNITAGQLVPLDVCHAFLARGSTSRRHCHHFAHIRVEYEHRLG